MTWRDAAVAGVPARVCRISFSGELAYEVNVSGWDAAGAVGGADRRRANAYGITPYGTETMHVLRAEKGYPIIGQDTDGTVTPQDLGMAWVVSKKKADFIGKRSFSPRGEPAPGPQAARRAAAGRRGDVLLPEGAQIVEYIDDGELPPPPVPMLGPRHLQLPQRGARRRTFALALVKGGRDRIGDTLHVPVDGTLVPVRSPAPCSSTPKELVAMADTLTRRSPLQSWQPRFASLPKSASLVEEPFVTMVDLWVDAAGPGGAAAADVLGVDTLPATSSTAVPGRDTTVIWFGPQEWLITSEGRAGEELEATAARGGVRARRRSGRRLGASAPPFGFGVHMPGTSSPRAARWTCTRRCSDPAPPRRRCSARPGVVLIPLSDNGTDYRIIVRSSFAGYLADWLIDAAEEFGVDW